MDPPWCVDAIEWYLESTANDWSVPAGSINRGGKTATSVRIAKKIASHAGFNIEYLFFFDAPRNTR